MDSSFHPASFCSTSTDESNKSSNVPVIPPIFQVENITVARPTLLKIFYWENFYIENLNQILLTQAKHITHDLVLPTRHLNSKPLKIVFWLRNLSNFEYTMHLKRIKNCQCIPKETRVGFNQFRNLYHCPHRRLINVSQEIFLMRPNELLAMSVVAYFYILGAYILTYELRVSDSRKIELNFHVNITTFDPVRCILNNNMIPVDIKEHRAMSQPLWIGNITNQNLQFLFAAKSRGLRLINPNIIIPPQSVWPLIVEYRPCDFENNLDLYLRYGERVLSKCSTGNRIKIPIMCEGFIQQPIENSSVPVCDYECSDYLYVIYPNRLEFVIEINEKRTLMVAVHNYNQVCMEFKWQIYAINGYFSFTFEPTNFTLKPHHSKLCVVQVKSFTTPLHFKRIPAILEVHRILEKPTQIAKQLLTEIESIDDPKWAENSYMEYVLLHLDLKVKYPKLQRINVKEELTELSNCTTIFEKLFWEYLSKSNYMRNTSKISKTLTYHQVLQQETNTKKGEPCVIMESQDAFDIVSFLAAEACRDLAKNYRFIPQEILDNY